jgi:hypothetical protein
MTGVGMPLLVLWSALTFGDTTCIADGLPRIPAPAGFVEASGLSEKLKQAALAGNLPPARLLGYYYQTNALAELLNLGYTKQPALFCKAVLKKDFTSISQAKQEFQTLVKNAKRETATTFDPNDSAIKRIFKHYEEASRDSDTGASHRVIGMSFLGMLVDKEASFAQSTLANLKFSDGQNEMEQPFVIALGFMRLGKKQISLGVAYPFNGESSVTSANRQLLDWIKAIEKLNPESSEAEKSTERVRVTGKE